MAKKNFVNHLVDKVRRGQICCVQFEELSDKVDELLEQGKDEVAEACRGRLMSLNRMIKDGQDAEEKLAGMIERAKLTPMEYLVFDLRYMQNMRWDAVCEKIRTTPQYSGYERSKSYYCNVLKRATEKIKVAGLEN